MTSIVVFSRALELEIEFIRDKYKIQDFFCVLTNQFQVSEMKIMTHMIIQFIK